MPACCHVFTVMGGFMMASGVLTLAAAMPEAG
jgi:hypothetical protein